MVDVALAALFACTIGQVVGDLVPLAIPCGLNQLNQEVVFLLRPGILLVVLPTAVRFVPLALLQRLNLDLIDRQIVHTAAQSKRKVITRQSRPTRYNPTIRLWWLRDNNYRGVHATTALTTLPNLPGHATVDRCALQPNWKGHQRTR